LISCLSFIHAILISNIPEDEYPTASNFQYGIFYPRLAFTIIWRCTSHHPFIDSIPLSTAAENAQSTFLSGCCGPPQHNS